MIPYHSVSKKLMQCYSPLIDYFSKKHNISLSILELSHILMLCDETNALLSDYYRVICDIKGCNLTSVTQGIYWKEAGYLCICEVHSQMCRDNKPMPELKSSTIKRLDRKKQINKPNKKLTKT